MPYARNNWKTHEVKIALANPLSSASGPAAHSSKHAADGELANHPMFQRARVTAHVIQGGASYSNARFHEKGADGTWVKADDGTNKYSNSMRKNNPMPKPEAGTHSTLNVDAVAAAVVRAFNDAALQAHLATLDAGNDMKVNVNFAGGDIGQGYIHNSGGTAAAGFQALFIYCKPNGSNKDVPIFQTVVPKQGVIAGGVTV